MQRAPYYANADAMAGALNAAKWIYCPQLEARFRGGVPVAIFFARHRVRIYSFSSSSSLCRTWKTSGW